MKVIMDIAGINSKVTVWVPDKKWGHPTDKEEASAMAIETVCMIKETDIDIVKII